jgi:hypothetical protein
MGVLTMVGVAVALAAGGLLLGLAAGGLLLGVAWREGVAVGETLGHTTLSSDTGEEVSALLMMNPKTWL